MAYHQRHKDRKKSNRIVALIVVALATIFALGIFIQQGTF